MNTNISYPVYASDYMDISGWKGNGSVAGIVDSANKIIAGYDARYTYEEAKSIAEVMNSANNDLILRMTKGKGSAAEIRT